MRRMRLYALMLVVAMLLTACVKPSSRVSVTEGVPDSIPEYNEGLITIRCLDGYYFGYCNGAPVGVLTEDWISVDPPLFLQGDSEEEILAPGVYEILEGGYIHELQ